jgi:hypothetical protein
MIKFVAFGDSFINLFSSLKNNEFRIYKFKGAPIKGLINKNENYKTIKRITEKIKIKYGFFGFGQVDFFFYIYKKKYLDNNINILNDIYNNCEEYVKLISELSNIENKYILGIYPNHIKNENYKKFLTIYNIFNQENINLISDDDIEYNIRNLRIKEYNLLLEKYCKKYNINFCNIYDNLVDNNGKVHEILLLKHNPFNIHINYEILLFIYLKKCLKFLLKYYRLQDIYNIAEKNNNNYIKNILKKSNTFNKLNFKQMKFNKKIILKFINTI